MSVTVTARILKRIVLISRMTHEALLMDFQMVWVTI